MPRRSSISSRTRPTCTRSVPALASGSQPASASFGARSRLDRPTTARLRSVDRMPTRTRPSLRRRRRMLAIRPAPNLWRRTTLPSVRPPLSCGKVFAADDSCLSVLHDRSSRPGCGQPRHPTAEVDVEAQRLLPLPRLSERAFRHSLRPRLDGLLRLRRCTKHCRLRLREPRALGRNHGPDGARRVRRRAGRDFLPQDGRDCHRTARRNRRVVHRRRRARERERHRRRGCHYDPRRSLPLRSHRPSASEDGQVFPP